MFPLVDMEVLHNPYSMQRKHEILKGAVCALQHKSNNF